MGSVSTTTAELACWEEDRSPRAPRSSYHLQVLGLSCFVVVMAFLLEVRPDDRVAFRGLTQYPFPTTCSSRLWLGVSCPGCGLTRATVHLARADWRASLRSHRLGMMMAAVILFQIPYRTLLVCGIDRFRIGPRPAVIIGSLLIAALLGNWFYEILR